MSTKECYQVKVDATMTNELLSLYSKLGQNMFKVRALSAFDSSLDVPDLNPEILEVVFDKCEPCKVTFTLYVELPRVRQNDSITTLPVEYSVYTGGHLRPYELRTVIVYPLPENVNSKGCENDCYSYEICRVECKDDESSISSMIESHGFKLVFPLSRELACLVPEFGLSGFYLKNLNSANLKTKVRLVPTNFVPEKNTGQIPAALLSYDPEACEAYLEFSNNPVGGQELYRSLTAGYEYLFNYVPGDVPPAPTLDDMAMKRNYSLRGVSKSTETELLNFDICYKPSLVTPSGYYNYTIVVNGVDNYCYEFLSFSDLQD